MPQKVHLSQYKLRRAKYDALKAEAIVPQVMHPNRDLACTKLCINGRFALKATWLTCIGNVDFPHKTSLAINTCTQAYLRAF
jgi:hypothetical protein